MADLVSIVRELQQRLPELRRHDLKEMQTRTILVSRILTALGWDLNDPREVQEESPTVDGKSVDYALRINNKPVLFVEAKPLGDPLDDVKSVTQVLNYASNNGVDWCVLTNGANWKVYRASERGLPNDKLMFEVGILPEDDTSISPEQVAELLHRLSKQSMADRTLDEIGEVTFTDAKVRKALDEVMREPPKSLLNAVREAVDDPRMKPSQIRQSLERVWRSLMVRGESAVEAFSSGPAFAGDCEVPTAAEKARRGRPRKETSDYSLEAHLNGRSAVVREIFDAVDGFCRSLSPQVVCEPLAKYIKYELAGRIFLCMHLQKYGVRMWLKLDPTGVGPLPSFARDMTGVGHWGTGDLELALDTPAMVDQAIPLIRKSFEANCRA